MASSRKYPKNPGGSAPTGKVFWSGRSQAVRLPRQFRLSVREVVIRKMKKGLLLEPVKARVDANGWPHEFWGLFDETVDELDVGRPERAHERPYPLGRKR
jgi:antitoxin VapB